MPSNAAKPVYEVTRTIALPGKQLGQNRDADGKAKASHPLQNRNLIVDFGEAIIEIGDSFSSLAGFIFWRTGGDKRIVNF